MRIGIDCRIAAYTAGGTAVYTRCLVGALASILGDCEDRLVLLRAWREHNGRWPTGLTQRTLLTPSHHRWEQWLLPLELGFSTLDLLHSPDFIPPFRRRCRSVITVHDLAFLLYPQFLTRESRRYFNDQISRAVASADRVIAVSEATRRDLIERLRTPAEKIDVVYEAAHPSFCRVEDRAAVDAALQGRGLPRDYVLFVGTLEPRKNLATLIRAFGIVRRQGYAGKLVLAGARGWLYEDVLAEVERQRLEQEVVFAGPVGREALLDLYNGARLLVLPSQYEGFGLPLLEAMACGTPVVTSNVSSLPEVAGDAAICVNPSDADALADAVSSVLSDEQLANTLRQKGCARVAEFSWERAARETLAVYHRAA